MEKGVRHVCGGIEYTLYRKSIKNMYIRISQGEVKVSANRRVPLDRIEQFILKNAQKIKDRLEKYTPVDYPQADDEQCRQMFEEISLKIYPLFKEYIGDKPPEIRVKPLRATWGICHTRDKYISLSQKLYFQPKEAVEYVILHEYVHFVHPNHQKDFHELMKKLMPDYKLRKKMLKS